MRSLKSLKLEEVKATQIESWKYSVKLKAIWKML